MDPKDIREKINKLGVDMRAIMDKAKAEQREKLTADEEKQFDAMDAERETLINDERRAIRLAELENPQERRAAVIQPGQQQQQRRQEERTAENRRRDNAEALRGFFSGGRATPEQRAAAARCGVNGAGVDISGNSLHLGLAAMPPASLRSQDLRDWEERGYLGVDIISPDTGGHYLVPEETMRSLEIALLAFGGMREVATIVRTDTGGVLPFPTINDTENEGAIIGEAIEETNEVLPTIGEMRLEAYTYSSRKIPVSMEFMQDNAVNFAARVGELLGTRIARITNRHFTVGDGSSKPRGIVNAATSSGVTTASASLISYDEVMNLEHSVDPAYRAQRTGPTAAKFMFHDSVLLALKKIKVPQFSGDTAGYPLWRQGMAVGEPDTIDGYQYVINQHMATLAASAKAMIFGALYKYQIRDVRTVEIQRLNELRAEFRQVLWLGFSRHDGDLLDAGTHPVKYLTMHS
jgi:HK97 family phage major capsid protein